MGIVKQDEGSSSDAGWQRIARFPHDHKDSWNGESTQKSRHGPVGDIGDLVVDVRVPYVVEEKVAIVADEPAGESK